MKRSLWLMLFFVFSPCVMRAISAGQYQQVQQDKKILEKILKDPSSISAEALEELKKRIGRFEPVYVKRVEPQIKPIIKEKQALVHSIIIEPSPSSPPLPTKIVSPEKITRTMPLAPIVEQKKEADDAQKIVDQFAQIEKEITHQASQMDSVKKIVPDYFFYDQAIYDLENHYLLIEPTLSEDQKKKVNEAFQKAMHLLSYH